MSDREKDTALARQGRMVALVIVGTTVLWLLVQLIGPELGLPDRFAFLFDLFALAAFLWAFIVTFGIWRRRKD